LLKNTSELQPTTVHSDTQGHTVTWTPHVTRAGAKGSGSPRPSSSRRCRCRFGDGSRMTARRWSSYSATTVSQSRWSRSSWRIWPRGAARRTPSFRTRTTCGTCGGS
jgi:hypothetical protein